MNLIPEQLLKNQLDYFPLQSRLLQQMTALRKRSTPQPTLLKKNHNQRESDGHRVMIVQINRRSMKIKFTESKKLLLILR